LTHREKPVTNFALSKCNLCHCAKAMVEWSATAVGIARQADTLAIIAADPEPKRNMKQIMLPALEVGEVRVNRSTYQVKPFYLSNRSTFQIQLVPLHPGGGVDPQGRHHVQGHLQGGGGVDSC
jgi:hypothetical protein